MQKSGRPFCPQKQSPNSRLGASTFSFPAKITFDRGEGTKKYKKRSDYSKEIYNGWMYDKRPKGILKTNCIERKVIL